ncbi:DUF1488 family protein [Chitinasiproducens palmae]|uniref:DUF1488 domain-containing protein n=1 Tax=Chitinasiproducens palmae TaxID=1770053 RepID=A0A1H2PP96_9BURK|nr:DUF1488 domain-containing protein [Chitinasiproducens palmae]SDV47704.1 Protein of unknown function [Chitinasiproducens palmae]
MKISFAKESPRFDGATSTVRFIATVDGVDTECAVSSAALQDHCDAKSALENDVIAAFESNRAQIESACRNALRDNGGEPLTLSSGQLRIEKLTRRHDRASQT